MIRLIAAALAAALLTASPAVAEPIVQSVESHDNSKGELERRTDGFVHRSTGYVFPVQLAEMPARTTVTYGPGDASVYYTVDGGGTGDAWLTLYVFDRDLTLAEEAAGTEEALLNAMPGTPVARPAAAPPLPPGAVERWFEAMVEGRSMLTGYRIIRDSGHFIKVRLSIPKAGGQQALDRGWRALGAVKWVIAPRTASLR